MVLKANILVVDDEESITETLEGILSDEGYSVDSVTSGDDALGLLQQHAYDLVLLDVWLPGRRDGLQTLREIRNRNLDVDVVMISGHGNIDTAVRATKLGAHNFLIKPLSLGQVLQTVETVIEGRRKSTSNGKGNGNGQLFIAESALVKKALQQVEVAAEGFAPMLIEGEQGSGKEYLAWRLHQLSPLSAEHFLSVNCGDISDDGFVQVFGQLDEDFKKSSSTFMKMKGTIYMTDPQQLKPDLLKRLQQIISWSSSIKKPRARFVCSITLGSGLPPAKKNIIALFDEKVTLPPLRERKQDLKKFVKYFLEQAAEDFGKPNITMSDKAMERILSYPWPGNVHELQEVIESSVMAGPATMLEPKHITFGSALEKSGKGASMLPSSRSKKGGSITALRQKTIGKSVVLTGLGLHSGVKTGIIISPLPAGSGIIFGDISTGRQVPALVENVDTTGYATSLQFGTTDVKTIEHLMATLHMYGISNAFIKVNDEIPIMDGSAAEFCELIEAAGVVEQDMELKPIFVERTYIVGDKNEKEKFLKIEPASILEMEYRMDYPMPIGKMTARFKRGSLKDFREELAPARTFGIVDDIKNFEKMGLAEGGKLTNVILVDNEKIVNTTLRFTDEFARHKLLDILGDIYLLGRPLVGKITANISGHTENISLLKEIKKEMVL